MAADEVQRVLETLLQPLISRVEQQQKTFEQQQKTLEQQQKTLTEMQKELGALTEVLNCLVERSIREDLEHCCHPSYNQDLPGEPVK